jgi:formamidopyrimidine-DNA glycosylase
MPELPEVETIRRDLDRIATGKVLQRIEVSEPRLLQNCLLADVQATLHDCPLVAMRRRGKFLIFNFGAHSAIVHLRMSGWFSEQPGNHTRMVLKFEGATLYFDDTRRFGTFHLVENKSLDQEPPLRGLGLEPLGDMLTWKAFKPVFDTNREVKRLLLDQNKIVGLGNIYVCEALHQAKIHPQQAANKINSAKLKKLRTAIQLILQTAIDNHGSTLGNAAGDYRTLEGAQGSFQDRFQVYGREGETCFRCPGNIERIVQAQRSTFFCPRCQK